MNYEEIAERTGLSTSTVYRIRNGKYRAGNSRHEEALKLLRAYNKTKVRRYKEKNIMCLYQPLGHSELLMHELEYLSEKSGCRFTYVNVDENKEQIDYKKYDGCLLMHFYKNISLPPVPTVAVNHEIQYLNIPSVSSDDTAGMINVFKYLQQLGHSRIGFFDDYAGRLDHLSYRRALIPYFYSLSGLEYEPELVFSERVGLNTHPGAIRRAVSHFCDLEKRPTALVIPGDPYSAVFYEQLKLRGIRIPEDISIIGYDNREMGQFLDPPLTTVDKTFKKMTSHALALLLKVIENPDRQIERILLEPKLIIRKSVANIN